MENRVITYWYLYITIHLGSFTYNVENRLITYLYLYVMFHTKVPLIIWRSLWYYVLIIICNAQHRSSIFDTEMVSDSANHQVNNVKPMTDCSTTDLASVTEKEVRPISRTYCLKAGARRCITYVREGMKRSPSMSSTSQVALHILPWGIKTVLTLEGRWRWSQAVTLLRKAVLFFEDYVKAFWNCHLQRVEYSQEKYVSVGCFFFIFCFKLKFCFVPVEVSVCVCVLFCSRDFHRVVGD